MACKDFLSKTWCSFVYILLFLLDIEGRKSKLKLTAIIHGNYCFKRKVNTNVLFGGKLSTVNMNLSVLFLLLQSRKIITRPIRKNTNYIYTKKKKNTNYIKTANQTK